MSAALAAKLVTMANQIAKAFDGQRGDAVSQTAEHLHAFWTPPMVVAIVNHLRAGGEGLSPTASAAVATLAAAFDRP